MDIFFDTEGVQGRKGSTDSPPLVSSSVELESLSPELWSQGRIGTLWNDLVFHFLYWTRVGTAQRIELGKPIRRHKPSED